MRAWRREGKRRDTADKTLVDYGRGGARYESNQRLIGGCDRRRTFIPVMPAFGRKHIRGRGGSGGCVSLVFSV